MGLAVGTEDGSSPVSLTSTFTAGTPVGFASDGFGSNEGVGAGTSVLTLIVGEVGGDAPRAGKHSLASKAWEWASASYRWALD